MPLSQRRPPTKFDSRYDCQRPEYVENSLVRHETEGAITTDDASLIREYLDHLGGRCISISRSNKVGYHLVGWRQFIGPFRTNSFPDLTAGIRRLREARIKGGRPYRQNTVRDFIEILKTFYRWLSNRGYSTIRLSDINELRAPATDRMTKTAADIFSSEEIRAMIQACQNSRDRALIAMLFDGGFRTKEIATAVWGDVKFDDIGVVVNTSVKTERPRHVRLIPSAKYLVQWRNDFPGDPTGDTLVFCTREGRGMTWSGVHAQIKRIAARAGITKRITPHRFRHSRVTDLLRRGVNDSVIKKALWGHTGTNQLATYEHLTNSDMDNALLDSYGIRRKEPATARAMDPRECPRCASINRPTDAFCEVCGGPLTGEVAMTMDDIRRAIEATPEWQTGLEAAVLQLTCARG